MRTDAMATVYPGNGTAYVRHIDNNTANGRVITTILYMNPIWEAGDGGELKLYLKKGDVVIEPIFNRFIVFWSDARCPHEVNVAPFTDLFFLIRAFMWTANPIMIS